MSDLAPRHKLDLPTLYGLFPTADDAPEYQFVPGEAVPPPYHGLLVHDYHMTVTMEAFYGDLVDVRVLAKRCLPEDYARKILLSLHRTGRVVQFGIVRVVLKYCSPAVQQEILAEQTPLGRILIKHAVLRRIEPTAYLRIVPGPAMMGWFGLQAPTPTYGRLAYIYCDHQPAVELLEIAAPVV